MPRNAPPSHPDPLRLPVFVYGTLRPGEKNFPRFLAGRTRRVEPATVAGRLFFVRDEGYPYVLPGPGRVRGELVELRPELYTETLQLLDDLEEYDPADEERSVYLRRRAVALKESGRRETVWIYYWNLSERAGCPVPGGDFRNRPGRERG